MMVGLHDKLKGIVLFAAVGESSESVHTYLLSLHQSWLLLFAFLTQRGLDTMTSLDSTAPYAAEDWLKYIELLDYMASKH